MLHGQNVSLYDYLWNIKSETWDSTGLSHYVSKAISLGSLGSKSLLAGFQGFSLKWGFKASKLSRLQWPTNQLWCPMALSYSLTAPTECGQREVLRPPLGPIKNEDSKTRGCNPAASTLPDSQVTLMHVKVENHCHSRNHLAVHSFQCSIFYWAGTPCRPCLWHYRQSQRRHCSYPQRTQNLLEDKQTTVDIVHCGHSIISFHHSPNKYQEPPTF